MPMVNLAFNLQVHRGRGYAPINDLEAWLGMPGHLVMIGKDGQLTDKVFRHLHADHGGHLEDAGNHAGPDVTFMLMDPEIPPAGVYKVWGQFKRQGRVLTVPFVIQL